jgi:hypothetical protein
MPKRVSHCSAFVEDFLKEARKTPMDPTTVGDVLKQTRQKQTRPQYYSQPAGKTDTTNPAFSAAQKAVPPPPVQ